MTTHIVCILDGAKGIYMPQAFYEQFDLPAWGLSTEDYKDLSSPDNECYWEAWDDLLRNAEMHERIGDKVIVWTLEQDGDLFANGEETSL